VSTGSPLQIDDCSVQESPGSFFCDLLGFFDRRPDPGTSNVGLTIPCVTDAQEKPARHKRFDSEDERLTVVLCLSCDDDLAHSKMQNR